MDKTKNTEEPTAKNLPAVVKNKLSKSDIETLEKLEVSENTNLFEVETLNFAKFAEGEVVNCLIEEICEVPDFNDKTKNVEAVRFHTKDGNEFVASQTVIVSKVKNIKELPCYARIICTGEKKGANKLTYMDFTILKM